MLAVSMFVTTFSLIVAVVAFIAPFIGRAMKLRKNDLARKREVVRNKKARYGAILSAGKEYRQSYWK